MWPNNTQSTNFWDIYSPTKFCQSIVLTGRDRPYMRLAIRGETDSVHLWRNPSVFVRVELPFRTDRERDGFMYFLYSRPRFRFIAASGWIAHEGCALYCLTIFCIFLYRIVFIGHRRKQLNGINQVLLTYDNSLLIVNTRKDINWDTFLFLWPLAVCWWWMNSEKLDCWTVSFSRKQQIWRQLVLQGVFDLSVEAIAIQKSTISSCTRRNFTVPNSSQASNQVLVRWRGVASQPLSSNSPAEGRVSQYRTCLDLEDKADSTQDPLFLWPLKWVNTSRVPRDCAEIGYC